MTNVIIVENEPRHSSHLMELLTKSEFGVSVMAVCTNVEDAYKKINTLQPDLIFLDIDLDFGETGFDLLKLFESPPFSVIFTTQYNTYDNAVSAIRVCALDFLTKPVFHQDLKDALLRFNKEDGIEQVKVLKQNIDSADGKVRTVLIRNTDGIRKIEITQIAYCESDNSYTKFHLYHPLDNKYLYVSSTKIKEWEEDLRNSPVVRCHNEYLVNTDYFKIYLSGKSDTAKLVLKNGVEVPVSKSRKAAVKKRLGL